MKTKRYDADHQAHQLMVREAGSSALPSTEVREVIASDVNDEIDLRDLIDAILRRRNVVIAVLLFVFAAVALYTFMATPQFKAKGVLRVSTQSDKLTKFENVESSALKTMEFQQTQVQLLKSEQLATRVIDRMDLANNPVFNPDQTDEAGEEQSKGLLETIKGFVRPETDRETLDLLSEDTKQQIIVDRGLGKFSRLFEVTPVRNSELIEVNFISTSPAFASEVINTVMDEFINMHMDIKLKGSQDASRFLEKQIEAAQIKLEKSEIELQGFAKRIGIVSLDSKTNLTMRQLEELNDALAKARAERITKEAKYQQVLEGNSVNLNQTIANPLIQELKKQYATQLAEYEELGRTFKPAYPKMQQLKTKLDQIAERINAEQIAIVDSIRNDYESALKSEEYLAKRTEEQKQRAMVLEEKATQYKILEREVATNKSIYQSLLERAKEIEATVGAAVTNIQVVDAARPPLYPFKPRIALNLAIGLALGLFLGIGLALFLEYFDNTIKNPDEMTERFGIPVLGLIPYDKEGVDDREHMATLFYNSPRSPVAEAIRTTMTSVRLAVADDPPKVILITSVLAGAGKSSLSCNVSLSYLAEDESCLLIECDLRKPSLHNIFNNGVRGKGLSSVLSGMEKLSNVIIRTEYNGLDFISGGPLPPNPAEMLSSKRMRELLEEVSQQYDRIILDCPPYQGFAEILVLSNMADGVILVAVEGDTPREGVKHFRRAITNVGGRILGTIINKTGKKKGYGAYGSYKYYSYNYSYGKQGTPESES